MRRRIASLPSLPFNVWNDNVLSAERLSKEAEAGGSFRKSCMICQKIYSSLNAYQNHLRSQKHLRKSQDSAPTELFDSDGATIQGEIEPSDDDTNEDSVDHKEEELAITGCLFCNSDSSTLEDNLQHMNKVHGLFIPYQDRLRDIEGLVVYLANLIRHSQSCIYCGTSRSSVEAIQQHMRDKGHCMIAFDEDSEADSFYGSSTQPLGSQIEEKELVSNTIEGESNVPSKSTYLDDDLELHLPSGKILGHRSQARYYRQNLHNHPTPSERAEQRTLLDADTSRAADSSADEDRRLVTQFHVGKGLLGVPRLQIRALIAVEKKDVSKEIRAKTSYEWGVQLKSNSQKHYRVSFSH